MFGYITADISRMSPDLRREYRSCYCGLCRALARNFGIRGRWLLSFDTAFLMTVLSALESETEMVCERCPYHFGRKRSCLHGDIADYAADVTAILACLNFEDDVQDDGSIKARIMLRIYGKAFREASARRPELTAKLKEYVTALSDAEHANELDAEIPAEIFGNLLGEVFAYNEKARAFGFQLGKFIYLMDAVCDFKSDLKHNRYNPLTAYRKSEFPAILSYVMSDAIGEYEKLDTKYFDSVIRNVLYYGAWIKYNIKFNLKVTKK